MHDYVKVLTLRNEVEAQMMDQALADQGIPHLVRSYHDSAYDGLFQTQKGWGHIAAPPERKDEIKAIYEELTGSEPDRPSQENPPA
jgi:outer membrane protein assembly factor BamE (lipoprotein component of BamABCDE complex)